MSTVEPSRRDKAIAHWTKQRKEFEYWIRSSHYPANLIRKQNQEGQDNIFDSELAGNLSEIFYINPLMEHMFEAWFAAREKDRPSN